MTLDEVRRLRAKLHAPQWNDTTLAERDAVYAMAERYAYLRVSGITTEQHESLCGDELDAAIDAWTKGGE